MLFLPVIYVSGLDFASFMQRFADVDVVIVKAAQAYFGVSPALNISERALRAPMTWDGPERQKSLKYEAKCVVVWTLYMYIYT